jgi:hypothetical protein
LFYCFKAMALGQWLLLYRKIINIQLGE